MKRTIAVAVWVMCASGMTLASAADPPASVPAADRIVAPENRGLFASCAGGPAAAAMLANGRDAATLAAADATFQRCLNGARNQAGVITADLGIATTAFFAARRHTGGAAVADYDRAAGYAHQAWSRAKMNGFANSFPISQPVTVNAFPTGTNHMVTGAAEDSALTRQITTDPAATFQRTVAVSVPPRDGVATGAASPFELGVALESAAARARGAILSAK